MDHENICKDPVFWLLKAQKEFGISEEAFRDTKLSAFQRYIQLATEEGYVSKESEKHLTTSEFAKRAIRRNNMDLLKRAITNGFKNWSMALYEAGKVGNTTLIDELFKFRLDYQSAAEGTLKGGYRELFDQIYSKGRDWNWQSLINAAAYSGNLDLFNYVASMNKIELDLNQILATALERNHKELFNHIRSLSQNVKISWKTLCGGAAKSGNKNTLDYIITLVPVNYCINWVYVLQEAVKGGNEEMFNEILKLVPPEQEIDWKDLVIFAARTGKRLLLKYILSLVPKNVSLNPTAIAVAIMLSGNMFMLYEFLKSVDKISWNYLLSISLRSEDLGTFDNLLKMVPLGRDITWNTLINTAITTANKQVLCHVLYLLPLTTNLDWNELINSAVETLNTEIGEYLLLKIPINYRIDWDELLLRNLNDPEKFDVFMSIAPSKHQWDLKTIAKRVTNDKVKRYLLKLCGVIPFLDVFAKIVQGDIKDYRVNKLMNFYAKPQNVIITFWDNKGQSYNCEVKINPETEGIEFP